jgi:catechol 2,3-dioxygenase-like lactoylglutathione lyase family enzyme
MKMLILIPTMIAAPAGSLWAQLFPPNEAGVSMGAWHTIVRDIDTTTKWWEIWGGKHIKIDGVDVMKFHGVFVFMVKGEPNGQSIDHFIDHVAFQTPNGLALVKKLIDSGVKTDRINLAKLTDPHAPGGGRRTWTYTYSPDGLRVEVETDEDAVAAKNFDADMTSDMNHFYFKDLDAMRANYRFYKTYFGGETRPDPNINLHIPGTKINYATDNGNPEPNALPFLTGELKPRAKGVPRPPNRGGALDYIGFEVTNLPAFVKKLQAAGVKFDEPYSKKRHKSYASAMFTGSGGEVVELTEGLRKF